MTKLTARTRNLTHAVHTTDADTAQLMRWAEDMDNTIECFDVVLTHATKYDNELGALKATFLGAEGVPFDAVLSLDIGGMYAGYAEPGEEPGEQNLPLLITQDAGTSVVSYDCVPEEYFPDGKNVVTTLADLMIENFSHRDM